MQPLDCIGGAHAAPLARRQAREGEQAFSCFLQAVGDGAMLEPPFADEGFAARLDLLRRRRVDHVVVICSDLVMQPLGGTREQLPVLLDRPALDRAAFPNADDRLVVTRRTTDYAETLTRLV